MPDEVGFGCSPLVEAPRVEQVFPLQMGGAEMKMSDGRRHFCWEQTEVVSRIALERASAVSRDDMDVTSVCLCVQTWGESTEPEQHLPLLLTTMKNMESNVSYTDVTGVHATHVGRENLATSPQPINPWCFAKHLRLQCSTCSDCDLHDCQRPSHDHVFVHPMACWTVESNKVLWSSVASDLLGHSELVPDCVIR